jgi:hypothetical protein
MGVAMEVWPIFLFGAPLVFIFLFKNKEARLIGIYSCAHFLFWFSSKPVLRFLISLLPILVVLASVALEQLGQFKSRLVHPLSPSSKRCARRSRTPARRGRKSRQAVAGWGEMLLAEAPE